MIVFLGVSLVWMGLHFQCPATGHAAHLFPSLAEPQLQLLEQPRYFQMTKPLSNHPSSASLRHTIFMLRGPNISNFTMKSDWLFIVEGVCACVTVVSIISKARSAQPPWDGTLVSSPGKRVWWITTRSLGQREEYGPPNQIAALSKSCDYLPQ